MYVAITRARKRLYLSYAASRMLHGQTRYGIVSRFIDEIPPELCKWIVVPEKQAAFGNYQSGHQPGFFDKYKSGGSASNSTYTGFKQSNREYGGAANDAVNEKTADYGREGAPDTSRANFETRRGDENHPFRIGANVAHEKFGEGVVLNFEGRTGDARVQVKFRKAGTKWLSLQYAKLTAIL